jgi:hypothetical protein
MVGSRVPKKIKGRCFGGGRPGGQPRCRREVAGGMDVDFYADAELEDDTNE